MIRPLTVGRRSGWWIVGAWVLPACLVEFGAQAMSVPGERFGRVVVSASLLAGAFLARGGGVGRRLLVLAAAVVVAIVAPGTTTEVVLGLVAIALFATPLVVGRLLDVGAADRPEHDRAPEPAELEPDGLRRFVRPAIQWFAVLVPVNLTLTVAGLVAGTKPDARIVWDASNFIDIARDGYAYRPLAASFPGYAMVIRGANRLLGLDHELAAILISDLSGLAAALLFWEWSRRWLDGKAHRTALWCFLLFPYSFMLFGVAYADGLLLALVLGSLLAVDRDRLVTAGLLGAAATFTRPNGLVLIPVLVLATAERSGVLDLTALGSRNAWRQRWSGIVVDRSRFRPRQLAVLLSAGGIGGYMFWMWRSKGDPLFFWSVQTTDYGHRAFTSPATWLKVEFLNRPWEFIHNGPDAVNQVASVLVVVAVLASLPAAGRRLGWWAALLGLGGVATLWVTATGFSPAGRYLLPYLPVLAVLAADPLARRPALARVVLAAGAVGSLVLAAAFASAFRLNW